MSTPIVPSITDEQLKDLESFASDSKLNIYRPMGWAHSVRCGNHLQTDHEYLSAASPDVMLALIARLRAAEKDAGRYRWLRDEERFPDGEMFGQLIVGESEGEDCYFGDQLDSVIDLHMVQQP